MRLYALCLSFLTLASSPSFGLSWDSLLWLGGKQTEAEKPEVVEVVRWRQPVCVLPAAGVQSCLSGLSNLQKEYERVNGKEFEEEQKKFDEFIKDRGTKTYENVLLDSSDIRSMYKLFEQLRPSEDDFDLDEVNDHLMAKRTVPLPKKIVQENTRDAKYFKGSIDKPDLIYVTKVLNAPVTATLVAHNCMPDVGIPLCEDEKPLEHTEVSENVYKEEEMDKMKLLEIIAKQQSVIDVVRQIMETSEESQTEENNTNGGESSEISNSNIDKASKQVEGLDLTNIFFPKNNDSNDFIRKRRHMDSAIFDKFKHFFNKHKDFEPIIKNDSVIMESIKQHPFWTMIQKHYNDVIQHIKDKKLLPVYTEPVPLANEGSTSEMSSEKPMNLGNHMMTAAANP